MYNNQSIIEVFGNHYLECKLKNLDDLVNTCAAKFAGVDGVSCDDKAEALEVAIANIEEKERQTVTDKLNLLAMRYARETGRYEAGAGEDMVLNVEIRETRYAEDMKANVQLKGRPHSRESFTIPKDGLDYDGRVKLAKHYLSKIGVNRVVEVKVGRKTKNLFESKTVVRVKYVL